MRYIKNKIILPLIFLIVGSSPAATAAPDLEELIRKVEQQYNGKSSYLTARMDIVTTHWQRDVSLEAWSLGRNFCLTRVLKPAKENGITTLKASKEAWNYLPRVDRVIKIPPSMMGSPWMGSHITNDDLIKSSHVDKDYDLTLTHDAADTWQITCLPKASVPVIWGKLVYTIKKEPIMPVTIVYYDDLMAEVRTIMFEDARMVDGHTLPMRMIVLPKDRPNEKTVLQYLFIRFDISIENSFFSLRNLKGR